MLREVTKGRGSGLVERKVVIVVGRVTAAVAAAEREGSPLSNSVTPRVEMVALGEFTANGTLSSQAKCRGLCDMVGICSQDYGDL